MVRTTWVYSWRKEDLTSILTEFKLDIKGTVEELRQRLATFVSEHGAEFEGRLSELQLEHQRNPSPMRKTSKPETDCLAVPPERSRETSPNRQTESSPVYQDETHHRTSSYADRMDKVRKWSVRFDGNKGPLLFLDRVEELANVYDMPLDWIPRTMPELLKDRALLWYRNCNKRWSTWKTFKQDFMEFFLPARYMDHLEDKIRERHQQTAEKFNDYVVSLLDLMRPMAYDEKQKLERIYRNSRQEFQLNIKRREFETLQELMLLAGDYEEVMGQNKAFGRQARPVFERTRQTTSVSKPIEQIMPIDPSKACRRCGQEGHYSRGCRNPSIRFCWTYGRKEVLTSECCGHTSGNDRRVRERRGAGHPQRPSTRQQYNN